MVQKARRAAKEEKDLTDRPVKGNTLLLQKQDLGLDEGSVGPNVIEAHARVNTMVAVCMTTVKNVSLKLEKRKDFEPSSTARNRHSFRAAKAAAEARRAKERARTRPVRASSPAKARARKAKARARTLGTKRVPKAKVKAKERTDPKERPLGVKAVVLAQEVAWTSTPRRTTPTRKGSACRGTPLGTATAEKGDATSLTAKKEIKLRAEIICSPCYQPPKGQEDL